jgi:sulfite reductase (NADPH) flavoprotein alpha-component
MSPANHSPLTDDQTSFEHGRAAGQHAAQHLGANAPLSPRQLAWLNGFLDGLLTGASLPQAAEPGRFIESTQLENATRLGAQRHEQLAPEIYTRAELLGRAELTSDTPTRVESGLTPDTNARSEGYSRLDAGRPEAGSRFDVAPHEAASRVEGALRSELPRFEPALRVSTQLLTQAASNLGTSANENGGLGVNATDLAVQVRASLATSSKRAANIADEGRSKYSPDNPFAARIVQITANQARNPSAWRLTLDVEGSGLRCRPGDVLGVVPSNDPDLVRRLLRRLGAKGQETVTTARGTGPAWRALLEEFSITQVTKELLWVLASSTRNTNEARQLETLANTGSQGSETPLATILRRFPSSRPSLNDFVNSLCPLVPQYYPLASARSRQADTLEILAAKHPNETRSVVHQLHQEKLAQGDWLPVFVDSKPHVHPPSEIGSPVILLAPGVGAACAFAFLAERAATRGSGRNWLFTSPIDGETEAAYAEHFAAWQTSRIIGRLDVSPTQQLGKRLLDHGEMVQAWVVDGSHLYVYGTKSDCHELEQALAQLLVIRARITQEEAHKRLDAMRTSGQLRTNTVS